MMTLNQLTTTTMVMMLTKLEIKLFWRAPTLIMVSKIF